MTFQKSAARDNNTPTHGFPAIRPSIVPLFATPFVICCLLLINIAQAAPPPPDCSSRTPPNFLDIVRKHVDIDVLAVFANEYLTWPNEITMDTPDWELKKVIKVLGKQRNPDIQQVIGGINKEYMETVETWTKVCQTQTVGRRRRR